MRHRRYRHRRKNTSLLRKFFLAFVAAITAGLVTLIVMWMAAWAMGPPSIHPPMPAKIYDQSGQLAGEAGAGHKRSWVPLKDIASPLKEATVAVEDRRFYQHHGFDLRRLGGAIIKDIATLSKKEGASTITMQYAKNLFLTNQKSWLRKAEEAFYTMRLETNYSKQTILEGYLNTIYYGHGAYGIEAASEVYFNKKASDLTLSEASILAGIPKGPSLYSPLINYERAKSRQKIVLQSMVDTHKITQKEADQAYNEPLHFVKSQKKTQHNAPYFQDEVIKELRNKLHFDQKTIATGGLKVYTTLNSKLQKTADKWVKEIIQPDSKVQTAVVLMNPKNGAVQALVGGRDYQKSSFDRAVQAKRSPGSSFKPYLYYAALRNGFTPSTTLISKPTPFTYDQGKKTYSPSNFGGYYANGPITLAQALALSDNIYAVKTHMSIGEEKLVDVAKKVGITSPLSKIPSLALGTKPVSVLEMARGYSAFANGGDKINPYYITKVVDREGKVLYQADPSSTHVLNKPTTFVLSQLMTGVFDKSLNDYTKVTGTTVAPLLSHKIAAKTGSTAADSWMAGFTPSLVGAVWVGYDKGETISTYPDTGYSKLIFAHVMEDALKGKPKNEFHPPAGVVKVLVDPDSGELATDACPKARWTYYLKGTEPKKTCHLHPGDKRGKSNSGSDLFDNLFKGWWPFH